ncbi:Transcriptional regulator ATRX [Hirschfeldia incana]|nr:Transcriptional regulator ATRX [Hirschfeldia incana]
MMAHQDNFDQRCNDDSNAQEDHTSMTIEFLRARLLAERAVSKSARAKLDGLSDKVAELEEQLKIVSLQRKKAEQATADVLAILEANGFHDHDDAYDSSSDQESYSQTTHSVSAKSLSWKGRRREAGSSDKTKESRNRRQRGFVSAYFSSPRHHRQGRSCRQIKRSESTRTVSEDHKRDGNTVVDLQGKEVLPKTSQEASNTVVDVTVMKGEESLQKLPCSNVLEKENSIDVNLEKALRKRAQVVGSYEDMEETQKQWEKKFTENKSSSALDVCDVGNHSDVTDESNGEKAQGYTLVHSLSDTKSMANEVELETSSHDNSVTSPDKCCKSCGSKSVEQDASPSGDNGKHISESPKSESSHSQSCKVISEHSSSTIRSAPVPRPNSRGGSFCGNATAIQKVEYPLVPVAKETSDACDSVLAALKQAKLSLQEKVNSLRIRKPEYLSESSYPSTPVSYMNTYALPIEPAAFGTKPSLPASMLEFPVGCAGLFRVPTDFSPDASTRNSFLASSSQKALVNHIPERDIPLLPGDQLFTRTLLDTERPLTTPYIGGPKLWTGFREDGQPVADTQEARLYKGTPRVSGSVRMSGNQLSSSSFNLERQVRAYTPMSPGPSLYADSVVRSREMYSTPYYTPAVGLPPIGGSSDNLFRRV